MSTTGTNTNTFRLTGKYLGILNDYIVQAKLYNVVPETKRDQVIEFITQVNDDNNIQPQVQLLCSIIEREIRHSQPMTPDQFFGTLINDIKNSDMPSVLPKLELIVEALDEENSDALAKIIGE